MSQAQRDWAKDFEELNKLITAQRFADVVVFCDDSTYHTRNPRSPQG